MKRVLLLVVLFFLPVSSAQAATTPLDGFLVSDQGYFGGGDPGWSIVTNAGSGGSFSMDSLSIQLNDNTFGVPLNYQVQTLGDGTLRFTFDIFQDGNRYQLDLAGLASDPANYYDVSGFLNMTAIPVPTPLLLLGSGLLGVAGIGRRSGVVKRVFLQSGRC